MDKITVSEPPWTPRLDGADEYWLWERCVRATLCSAYSDLDLVHIENHCDHLWCQGALEVYRRRQQ